jgi:hypothetical protein
VEKLLAHTYSTSQLPPHTGMNCSKSVALMWRNYKASAIRTMNTDDCMFGEPSSRWKTTATEGNTDWQVLLFVHRSRVALRYTAKMQTTRHRWRLISFTRILSLGAGRQGHVERAEPWYFDVTTTQVDVVVVFLWCKKKLHSLSLTHTRKRERESRLI